MEYESLARTNCNYTHEQKNSSLKSKAAYTHYTEF